MINIAYTILINLFGVDPTKVYLTMENEYVIKSNKFIADAQGKPHLYSYQYVYKGKMGRFRRTLRWRATSYKLNLKAIL